MSIKYNSKEKTFNIQTSNTSYVLGVLNNTYLLHLYYGKRISEYGCIVDNMPMLAGPIAFSPNDVKDTPYSTNNLPIEYPTYGSGDFRTPALHLKYNDDSEVTKLEYERYEIFKGKKALCGLPATYIEADNEAETLEITLCDKLKGIKVVLSYTAFAAHDAICKSVRIINNGSDAVDIRSAMSSTIYMFDKHFEVVHLAGAWATERHIQKAPLSYGMFAIESKRCSSSHFHSPFMALARPEMTETQGEVYGLSLVYSGNFSAWAELSEWDVTRVSMGINPFGFNWRLGVGEEFQTPEVVLTYSQSGLSGMSRIYHRLYRTRLCRGKYRDEERPILINNWEATYFDFNEQKILEIAKKAKALGIELMVLDDGWFGKRDSDNSSLGDWTADRCKLPEGIEGLADKVTAMGMKLGLWFEPEMVSEDSDLYRAHPDWCIYIDGRSRTLSRNQLVLDLSRTEVCDYVVEAVSRVLNSASISYVKWDMNRNITEPSNAELPHRYMLGLYDVLERLTSAFPDVLFEGCSGGGGRFDAGMLYYFPQYWTSDDTDAIERVYIQHGTSVVMPSSSMGAHVSAVPNHQVGRTTPLSTRGTIAMTGQFGYELDLSKLTDEEADEVKAQIQKYKTIRETIHNGDMYRLLSPFEGNAVAWEYVLGNRVVLIYCVTQAQLLGGYAIVKFDGLDENKTYTDEENDKSYGGDYLMNVGLRFRRGRDYESKIIVLKIKEQRS